MATHLGCEQGLLGTAAAPTLLGPLRTGSGFQDLCPEPTFNILYVLLIHGELMMLLKVERPELILKREHLEELECLVDASEG